MICIKFFKWFDAYFYDKPLVCLEHVFLSELITYPLSALAEIRGIVVDTNMLAVVPKRTCIETCKISLIILNIIDESVRHTFNFTFNYKLYKENRIFILLPQSVSLNLDVSFSITPYVST